MSFQLAVFSDEVSQDLSKAIEVCKDFSLHGVEIRSVWDRKGPHDLSDDDLKRINDLLGEAGLAVCAISTPFLKCDIGNTVQYQEHIGILRRSIEVAHSLNAPIIRGFTYWRTPDPNAVFDQIVEDYAEPVRILNEMDMVMGIENEASTNVGSGAELRRFIDAVGSERVVPLWDPCNERFLGPDFYPFPDGYEHVRGRVAHVHIKDARWNHDKNTAECTPIGDGEVRMAEQLAALQQDGYNGWLSLETHWRPTELSEEELNRPGGASFSKEGEYASRVCLEKMIGILDGLAGR
ncbi:MAG: sugar phosphate isomerase/epimerase family protein [bacterium]